jgi:hypothetical protein
MYRHPTLTIELTALGFDAIQRATYRTPSKGEASN